MEYISSDTNVWIDFNFIDKLEYPFRLDCVFIMNNDAIEDEILNPPELKEKLINYGLMPVEITTEEFFYANNASAVYRKLSKHDLTALAIAKCRNIILLTGDKNLRKAADQEGVTCIGTIGIVDQLFSENKLTVTEYYNCLLSLKESNGSKVRLPEKELEKRIEGIRKI